MNSFFEAFYIDDLSQFIVQQTNLPSSFKIYLNYIISFIVFLILVYVARKIWALFLRPVYMIKDQVEEARRTTANEKTMRRNIKRLLLQRNYKAAAELYYSLNEPREAAKLYIQAKLPVKAAEIYEQMGNLERAAMLYKEAHRHLKSAELYEKIGDRRNAAELYEKGGFFKKAADLYKKINENLKAAELYERCYIEEGSHITKRELPQNYAYISGKLYEKANQLDNAISIFLRAGYRIEAGLVYEKLGKFIEAAELYLEAGELEKAAESFESGGDEKRRNDTLCQIYYHKGRLKEAASFAEKAGDFIRAAEILSEAKEFLLAGEQYLKEGWYSEAGEMFMKANNFNKAAESFEMGGKYIWAAQAYEKIGSKTAKVAELYEKGGEFLKAGIYYNDLGLLEKSLNALQKIDETSEYYKTASMMIGEIFMHKGTLKPAIERFQKVINNRPVSKTILEPYYFLALCYEESGERQKAKEIYNKILSVNYMFKDVNERLERITTILKEESVPVDQDQEKVLKEERLSPYKELPRKRYQLLQEIGRGGMGIVYKAKDTLLDRIVAYKILPSFLNKNPENLEKFLKEARISANLNHRNIIMIFDTGVEGENNYITMEYVEGKTLDKYLREGKNFKISDIINIAKQVCRALTYAHKKNVVHRDIKPSNIMIRRDGIIKIMDFGIAKVLEDISKETTSISGTPLYMSPEQIIGKDVDFQTDLYSFGVTLFELLTGRAPFIEGDIYYHHLHSAPISPKKIDPSIPDGLCNIVLKCLEKDKTKRYKKAEEILADLHKLSNKENLAT